MEPLWYLHLTLPVNNMPARTAEALPEGIRDAAWAQWLNYFREYETLDHQKDRSKGQL